MSAYNAILAKFVVRVDLLTVGQADLLTAYGKAVDMHSFTPKDVSEYKLFTEEPRWPMIFMADNDTFYNGMDHTSYKRIDPYTRDGVEYWIVSICTSIKYGNENNLLQLLAYFYSALSPEQPLFIGAVFYEGLYCGNFITHKKCDIDYNDIYFEADLEDVTTFDLDINDRMTKKKINSYRFILEDHLLADDEELV